MHLWGTTFRNMWWVLITPLKRTLKKYFTRVSEVCCSPSVFHAVLFYIMWLEIAFFLLYGHYYHFLIVISLHLASSSRYGFSKSVQIPRLFFISWLIEQFASSETKCLSLIFLCWTLFFYLFYFPSPLAILQYYCRGRSVWSPVSGSITSWWWSNEGLCWPHWVEIWSQSHNSPMFYH